MATIGSFGTIKAWRQAIVHQALARVGASEINKRFARGVFWSVIGSTISRGLMLVATIVVARLLGKDSYGELGMIQSTVGMFGVFAGFGLGLTATKYVAEYRERDPARAGRIIGMSGAFAFASAGLMALTLVALAPWLAADTINAPHLTNLLRIGAIILFFSAMNGAQTGALAGLEAFKKTAQVNVFVGLVAFPVLLVGTYLSGLQGAVTALAINLGFNWLFNHLALRKEAKQRFVPLTLVGAIREWPILWRFSLPSALAGMMVGPVTWACSAMLANQPDGYGELGIYNAANQWHVLLMYLPGILSSVLLPILSKEMSEDEYKNPSRMLILSIRANLLIVAPLVLILSALSPFIMQAYGSGFEQGWPTFIVAMMTALVVAAQTSVAQVIIASGRVWMGLLMNVGWALTFVVLAAWLVQNGALGLASAKLGAYLLQTIWVMTFAYRLINSRNQKSEHFLNER